MLEETSWRAGSAGRGHAGSTSSSQETSEDGDIQGIALSRAEERLQDCALIA
jgi:hypothetical protein